MLQCPKNEFNFKHLIMTSKKQIDTLMMPISSFRMMFVYVIIISLLIATFFVFIGIKYHSRLVIILGPLLCVGPAIFIRLRINLFAKKVTMTFSKESIEIKWGDKIIGYFFYSDIKYFSVSKVGVDYASKINFILANDTKIRYMFFKQFEDDDNVLNNVLLHFSSYNIGKIQDEKIQALPSFFMTKQGKLIIYCTGLLILTVIITQIIIKPKAIPFSLIFALATYIQVNAIQRNDMKILKKFNDQN